MGKGFTLIELMIVIAIILIVAMIAIPALLRSRIAANEGATMGTLRTICTAQTQFKSQGLVDQNRNGSGEYGTLGELTGTVDIRTMGTKADPTFLPRTLAPRVGQDFGQKSGYYCKMYLPGDSAIVTDNGLTALAANATNGVYQEGKWRVYAWPAAVALSGLRVFAIDQAGEIYATANRNTLSNNYIWSGSTFPAYNVAINATQTDNANFICSITKGIGSENQNWEPTN